MNKLQDIQILIVDDEPLIREILEFEMQTMGAKTTLAENGNIAFDLIQKNKYDIVISDVMMPEGNGLILAENIFKLGQPKPILFFCSGFNDISKAKISELGVSGVFPKPFDKDRIIQAIQDARIKKVG